MDIIGIIILLLIFGGPIFTVLGWILNLILAVWEFFYDIFEGIGDFFRGINRKKQEKKRKKEFRRREKLRQKHFGFHSIDEVPQEKLLLEDMYLDHSKAGDEARALQCAKAAGELGSASCAYYAAELLQKQGDLETAERYAQMAGNYKDADRLLFRIRRARLVRDGITAYDAGSWQEALDKLKQAVEMDFDPKSEAVERSECYYYTAAAAAKLAETVAQWEQAYSWTVEVCKAGKDSPFHERAEALKTEIFNGGGTAFRDMVFHKVAGWEALDVGDREFALESFQAAADLGSHEAFYGMAYAYSRQRTAEALDRALDWAHKAQQVGDKRAEKLIDEIRDEQALIQAKALSKDGKKKEALELLDTLINKGMKSAAWEAVSITGDMAKDAAGWEKQLTYLRKYQELGADSKEARHLVDLAQSNVYMAQAEAMINGDSGTFNVKDALSLLDKATKLDNCVAPTMAAFILCQTVINRTKNKRYEYETYNLCRERLDEAADWIKTAKRMQAPLKTYHKAVKAFEEAEAALRDYKGF